MLAMCYQCASSNSGSGSVQGIGVCQLCSCIACPSHGGLPRQQPRFVCSRCIPGTLTRSAGGGGSGPSGGRPAPTGPSPGPGGVGPGGDAVSSGPDFESSLDFESQLPQVAQASSERRGQVDLSSVREAVRRLFGLLQDQEGARSELLERIRTEAAEPVRDDVFRQIRQRDNASRYWDERGGVEGAAATELETLVGRFASWLEFQLGPWLETIYPVLDAHVWVGARDEPGGILDTLLLADAIGLHAFSWGMQVDESPFRRLDVVAGAEPGMVVLAELYSQAVGAFA
jgi:hypothetical protein